MICAVNAGHIPLEETMVNALAQWANDAERRLLGLHCGQMLCRDRHRQWAVSRMFDVVWSQRDGCLAWEVE